MNNLELQKNFIAYIEEYHQKLKVPEDLKDSMKYSLISEGKYFRPLLYLNFLVDNNLSPMKFYDIALAIEMIHTYSLIHDDLPSMDDDDYRRGKLSSHKKFGEDIAILTGDALLTESFNLISNNKQLTSEQKIEIIQNLSYNSGINGMIEGQILDIKNNVENLTDVQKIHLKKTGCLLAVILKIAAITVKNKNLEFYYQLGLSIGLYYQIQDDYLDEYGNFVNIGKTQGKDLKNHKKTYAYFYTKEELEELLKQERNNIKNNIKDLGERSQQTIIKILERQK